jgi:SAM-dependent methyltransferase
VALDYPSTGRDLYGARPDVFGDAGRLPFAGGAFDGIVCLEVLEHVSDPDAALAEIARVLKRGGRALVSMPFLYPVHDAPHDYQRWTNHGWARSAARAGLEIVTIAPIGSAVRTAGLLACLAIAGPLQRATLIKQLLLAPVVLLCVPVINLAAVIAERLWPRWDAMPVGLELELRRP